MRNDAPNGAASVELKSLLSAGGISEDTLTDEKGILASRADSRGVIFCVSWVLKNEPLLLGPLFC